MPVTPEPPRPCLRRAEGTEPLRRKSMAPLCQGRSLWRRALSYLLVFGTAVLLVDALVGERGLVATTRARRQAAELEAAVAQVRAENARLREEANRLEGDARAIESLARETLGLIRQGEVLVVVKDIKPKKN
jgi:cell division protein FtsB